MTSIVRVAGYAALFFALSLLLAGSGAQAGPLQTLQTDLAAGKPMVLIVSRQPTGADMKDEAYADWAGLLNDFAQEHRGTFHFVTVDPAAMKEIFAENPPIIEPFAVIFFRNTANALYYDGMIHDSSVYRAAASFLIGKENAQADALRALKPFRFRFRAANQ